ncbi:HNH endonuclease [Streptomyces virginiae]|uniref:HNH endonuclease n=1 Tax=Streptomyces virginiae TaxID=1961 RepID=UPI0030E118E6
MWRVDPPNYSASFSFRTCIGKIRDPDLKKRLQEAEAEVVAAAESYAAAAELVTLHALVRKDFLLGEVTKAEMTAVYKNSMAKKLAPGRFIYDSIKLAAKGGRCPLCGQRTVTTLDHHLPKALYPALSVDPLNLVPACADCNKLKLDKAPGSSGEETLHPYFDNVEDSPWLRAEVVEVSPAAFKFYVDPPGDWSQTLIDRVRLHFKTFGLGELYVSQAADELLNIRYGLNQLFNANPSEGSQNVRLHLMEQAESRRQARINSWQTATYAAMAESAWFCAGGFAEE